MKKILILSLLSLAFASTARAACVDLSGDLGQGSSGSAVLSLQAFLKDAGYLSAAPNGNFGPATAAAVKKLQQGSGIDQTGFAGPSTRAKIRALSCPASSAGAASTPAKGYGVTSPRAGDSLAIGKSYKISWTTEVRSDYSLVLEDESGIAQGFIVSNQTGGKSFVWKAGRLSTSSGEKNAVPGTYRVRIQKTSTGRSDSDETSGYFTLAAPGLAVTNILPSAIEADSGSVVVLYGSGFTASTFVYLDGIRNIQTSRLFVSPDGRAIVFTVPDGVAAGTHFISLKNGYESIENAGRVRIEEKE